MGFGSNKQRGAERCRGVMDKENNEYPTSRDNRRIFRHSAPMRLGANEQRGIDSVRKNANEMHKVKCFRK